MLIGAEENKAKKVKKCIFTKPGLPKVFTHLASELPLPALPKAGCSTPVISSLLKLLGKSLKRKRNYCVVKTFDLELLALLPPSTFQA